ncbi:hypothetical protein COCNU_12G007070 [Cocos nucifera]|uniref:Uncharacterized protein n=1 Tax=Cocos nucifera TaxID=13894 RepID=A0A8K0IRV1_COCNU|nr:hypothetical protein COCNU_12G007070 [Cocos nucifera]
MASDDPPRYPERRPTGNPYPKRGQIKVKIAEDIVSAITSMLGGGRWREGQAEREGRAGESAADGYRSGKNSYS